MPSACIRSVTHGYNIAGGGRVSVTGTAYVDYLYTNYPDCVVVTSRILLSRYCTGEAKNQRPYVKMPETPYWAMLTYSYSGYAYNSITSNPSDYEDTTYHVCSELASFTVYKTHSPQNLSVTATYGTITAGFDSALHEGSNTVYPITLTETLPQIPAKDSYTVSYDANYGTGAPSSQTKWYNETLTLTTSKPTRTGFTFKGWATSSTGGVVYASGGSYTANASITLYAVWERNSYVVTYNANGGSGAPANQTKYYAIDLTLSNNAPTFSGYTFKGWATSKDNASAGTVSYSKGATYQGNAALSLYAVWELTYRAPTITNLSVERYSSQTGQLEDDGDCALVTFDWTVFRSSLAQYYGGSNAPYASNSIANDGCVVTVGTYTEYRTPTGASDTTSVVVGSAFNTDQSYSATISITDDTNHTTTVTGTLPTQYFPMDFNADATAVGFFTPAPNDNEGAFFGKDIHVYVDTATASDPDYAIYQALVNLGWTDVLE